MSDQDPKSQRDRIINQLYEAVVHPDHSNDFLAQWDAYISRWTAQMDDACNARAPEESLLRDEVLEGHFSRAYAILEQLGRVEAAGHGGALPKTPLFRFDLDGNLTESHDDLPPQFARVAHARHLGRHFLEQSAQSWFRFLHRSKNAPALQRLNVFALRGGNNLVAVNHRDRQTGEVTIHLYWLKPVWSEELSDALQNQFDLTEAELRLVEAMVEEGSLDQISTNLGRSKFTLRNQLKAIFRKLNVSSQPEVLRTVTVLSYLFLNPALKPAPGTAGLEHAAPFETVTSIKSRSGMTFPVHEIGPTDGRPVLFIHGMMDGVGVTQRVVRALEKHNIRLIAPIRPNFGAGPTAKDVAKDPAKTVDRVTDQLIATIRVLRLERAALLGHMSGAPFAFAAEEALGSRVAGIINISGGVPIKSLRQFAKLGRRQKAFAYTTRFAPAILPAILRLAVAQIDADGVESLMHDMYRPNSPDIRFLKDAEAAAVIQEGYRFCAAQGYPGFEEDAKLVTGDWSALIKTGGVPVQLLHGAHDPAVELQFVQAFAEERGYALETYPEDGQLIFYSQPERVMQTVSDFMEKVGL
ncbi:MAG: alpha/beta hydrolase [Pseudomonadota bacterium]